MQVHVERKSLWISMLYALVTFRRTPVILVDGRLVSQGRVPRREELRAWILAAQEVE